ncbi:Berberine/berberine-like protein [Cynara cardunculus var. scolymus]|uniref:Berberine/berberine-like protein n=1 Tax=Cynara cardunculus var. scolymus TaxID=59895 RepID=A0A103XBC3_CYNCS|nr:Berberine/berberine-like protein [Cynara cardunculus var. scolymus]
MLNRTGRLPYSLTTKYQSTKPDREREEGRKKRRKGKKEKEGEENRNEGKKKSSANKKKQQQQLLFGRQQTEETDSKQPCIAALGFPASCTSPDSSSNCYRVTLDSTVATVPHQTAILTATAASKQQAGLFLLPLWTSIANVGLIDDGRKLLDNMIQSDEASWNSMLMDYATNGEWKTKETQLISYQELGSGTPEVPSDENMDDELFFQENDRITQHEGNEDVQELVHLVTREDNVEVEGYGKPEERRKHNMEFNVKSGLQIRIQSRGHDYEGLSYTSFDHTPFIILDVTKLRSVTVDSDDNTACVESGATLGELYYWVSQKSDLLGFPAGFCPTVGVGGDLSGGGFGMTARKYGLAADNVIDARIVNINGQILNRGSMGEDLFWAIRGGGGASFGVILAWKMKLVHVPPIVTVFSLSKRLDKGATRIVNKWQYIGHKLREDLFISLSVRSIQVPESEGNRTMQVTFNSLFLGMTNELMTIVNEQFPELQLHKSDCIEMSWIESVIYFSVFLKGETIDSLIERRMWPKNYFKVKSGYVKKPIPEETLEEIWKWCLQEENTSLLVEPHGGRISEIDESETPYPHREGNLYIIQYIKKWDDDGSDERHIGLIRRIHENPREAYVNFRDMDLGTNVNACSTSYLQAKKWGSKYFKGNFRRLAMVKGKVDPENFFCHEQSIPPLVSCKERLPNGNCYNDGLLVSHQTTYSTK